MALQLGENIDRATRPKPYDRSNLAVVPPVAAIRSPTKAQCKKTLLTQSNELEDVREELRVILEKNSSLEAELKEVKDVNRKMTSDYTAAMEKVISLENVVKSFHDKEFTYSNLVKTPSKFSYFCGLSVGQFNLLYDCVKPYVHLMIYHSYSSISKKETDKAIELFAVLSICRHSFVAIKG